MLFLFTVALRVIREDVDTNALEARRTLAAAGPRGSEAWKRNVLIGGKLKASAEWK